MRNSMKVCGKFYKYSGICWLTPPKECLGIVELAFPDSTILSLGCR